MTNSDAALMLLSASSFEMVSHVYSSQIDTLYPRSRGLHSTAST